MERPLAERGLCMMSICKLSCIHYVCNKPDMPHATCGAVHVPLARLSYTCDAGGTPIYPVAPHIHTNPHTHAERPGERVPPPSIFHMDMPTAAARSAAVVVTGTKADDCSLAGR